jgi:hypothetical protein
MSIQPLPLSYRADLIHTIYKYLDAGKCGALYGVASSGKSRLVEFMGRPDVRQHYQAYFGGDWTKTLFPWVDGNDLLEYTEWGLCEKILSAISADLEQLPERGGAARRTAQEWYWKLVLPENRHLARRMLMLALDDLPDFRVVLLFDDLDELIARAEDVMFRGLRSLRDRFKRDNQYRLLYLLFARRPLAALREDEGSLAFESFLELFKNFSHPIGCYSHDDALNMIRRLGEAYPLPGRTLTNDLAEQLIEVTGGHAGLLDAAFHSGTEAGWKAAGMARALIQAPAVWNECVSIYESLSADNWIALVEAVRGSDPGAAATRVLEEAGLVRRAYRQGLQPNALLKLFIADQQQHGLDIRLNPERHTVSIDGCVTELTEREYAVVQQLHQRRGQACSYFELHQTLAPTLPYDIPAQEDLRKLLRRVENKLTKSCSRRIIVHETGRSCRMIGTEFA